ncbi:hypothetical protein BGW36DRAFT_145370 [Talaromyces proteolyticus]|uniref:Zn(2)-C6 fungal-type domain-containing protein n=1 Tax=Talaromyces proteolyticus TaxID=1131652 RepID=A0AAD4KSJ6_9EURO|nr:uncharacterized protein BGW36DRAFT_145370 [Talaromyces proteolyticus]KAH8698402.1 hypothetical protein BGW36DRAFT_145370 [Talaromyces proteolyticus]
MEDNEISPRVCLNCRSGKRKCDKTLPACSRCSRLQLHCKYSPQSYEHASSRMVWSIVADYTHRMSRIRTSYTIMQQDDSFITTYFSTIHTWLPIINKSRFQSHIEIHPCDSKELLLLMSMHLIVQRPDSQPVRGMMDNEQYRAIKQLYSNLFLEAEGSPSTEILQSGVLLATYEYGHGMVDTACHTLSLCISAGMASGLHRSRVPSVSDLENMESTWSSTNELIRTWWAIVISDRLFCLSFPPGQRIALTKVPEDDVDDFLDNFANSVDGKKYSSPNQKTSIARAFYSQIQTSILIERVIRFINKADSCLQPNNAQFKVLDSKIRQIIHVALEAETTKLNSISEALAAGRNALLLLHQWCLDSSIFPAYTQEATESRMAIETMTRIMVETCREFLPKIYAGWSKSHHPHGTQLVFLAALQLRRSHATTSGQGNLGILKEMLQIQSRRWHIAAKNLEEIKRLESV